MNLVIVLLMWLHILATIGWIGAMIMLMFVIIPSAKESLQDEKSFKDFMKSIGKKMSLLVNLSIITLIISGIALVILVGINSTPGLIYLIIKHSIIAAMVIIHVSRILVIAPRIKNLENVGDKNGTVFRLKKLQMNLVWVNLVLGVVVIFLSVIL